LAEWLADRLQQADLHAERARAGAVGERRRPRPAGVAGRQEHDAPQAEPVEPVERERTSRGRSATESPRKT
jgi:hypothetical protein